MQEALEAHDGASKGKYTIGLGQDCMAFCSEVEDVISMRYSFFFMLLASNKTIGLVSQISLPQIFLL